jgi:uncharacterized protein YkwD
MKRGVCGCATALAVAASLVLVTGGSLRAQEAANSGSTAESTPAPGVAVSVAGPYLIARANEARRDAGLPEIAWHDGLAEVARGQAARMAASGTLYHNPNLRADVERAVPSSSDDGEICALDGVVENIHPLFMDSPPHRAIILGGYNLGGAAVVADSDGRLWATEVFARAPRSAQPVATSQPARTQRPARSARVRRTLAVSTPKPAVEPSPVPTETPLETSSPLPTFEPEGYAAGAELTTGHASAPKTRGELVLLAGLLLAIAVWRVHHLAAASRRRP